MIDSDLLRIALRKASVDWVLDGGQAELEIFQEIRRLEEQVKAGLGRDRDLLRDFAEDDGSLAAVVQTFATAMSTEFRVMAYVLVTGGEVERIRLKYDRLANIEISVRVKDHLGKRHDFSSTELWDMEAFRHFGLLKVGGRPVIDGYYATRLPGAD